MEKRYCFKNVILNETILPLCKDNFTLSKDEHNLGYRITSSTLGLNEFTNIKQLSISNSFMFGNITITFYYKGTAKTHQFSSSVTGQINLSLNLALITVEKDNKFFNNYVITNELEKLREKISKKILPNKNLTYIDPNLLSLFNIKSDIVFEFIIKLVDSKSPHTNLENIRMIPDNYVILIDN